LGGYNQIGWKSNGGYGITEKSFIFSFRSKGEIKNTFSRVMDINFIINRLEKLGLSFGHSNLIL